MKLSGDIVEEGIMALLGQRRGQAPKTQVVTKTRRDTSRKKNDRKGGLGNDCCGGERKAWGLGTGSNTVSLLTQSPRDRCSNSCHDGNQSRSVAKRRAVVGI